MHLPTAPPFTIRVVLLGFFDKTFFFCCCSSSTRDVERAVRTDDLRRVVLGDGLGALRHGVLGQFTGQHQTNGGLDFGRTEGCFFVVRGQLAGFRGNALEDVVAERVHDGHSLFGDSRVGMDLLENPVDVGTVGFRALLVLLGAGSSLLGRLGGLLGGCLGHLEMRFVVIVVCVFLC